MGKKWRKRLLSIFLCAAMVLGLLPEGTARAVDTQTAYYIQNEYVTNAYLYDDNGIVKYGVPAAETDTRYQWIVGENGGYKTLKNVSTGNYININGHKTLSDDGYWADTVSSAAWQDDTLTYLWDFDTTVHTNILTASTDTGYAGFGLHVQDQSGLAQCSNVPTDWGSMKWIFIESAAMQFEDDNTDTAYYIQNEYVTNAYLYDDNGIVKYGVPAAETDTRYQWIVGENGGYKTLKNVSTGNYININGHKTLSDDGYWADTVSSAAWQDDLLTYLWDFDTTAHTNILTASTDTGYAGFGLHVQDQSGLAQCSNVPTDWGSMKWIFIESTSMQFEDDNTDTAYYIQNEYVTNAYLYDDNGIVKYGVPAAETDTRYQWIVGENGGYKTLKNVSTGNYININGHKTLSDDGYWADTVSSAAWQDGLLTYLWDFDTTAHTNILTASTDTGYVGFGLHVQDQSGLAQCSNVPTDWGSMKWIFIDAADMDLGGPEYDTIQNSYYLFYMYEENGQVLYGNIKRSEAKAQWEILTDEATGLTAIKNKATGHYVLPGTGDQLVCIDSANPYYWSKASGSQSGCTVFGDSVTSDNYLHMEDKKGYVQNSVIPASWGTPQWIVREYTQDQYKRIKSSASGLYLYEDSDGYVRQGALDNESLYFQWLEESYNGKIRLKNRATGHYISTENISAENTLLQSLSGQQDWTSIQWNLTELGDSKVAFSNVYRTGYVIQAKATEDYVRCDNLAGTDDPAAALILEEAPEISVSPQLPEGYIRLKDNTNGLYLYENANQVLVYGLAEEGDLRSHFLITGTEDGYYTLKNRATGNYITVSANKSYLQCLPESQCQDGARWSITYAEGSQCLLLNNKQNPTDYLNIGALAGFAQSSFVSTESGSTQWVLSQAPEEGYIPETSEEGSTSVQSFLDTNQYYALYQNQYLTGANESVRLKASPYNSSIWQLEYYNGKVRILNKETGRYLYYQNGWFAKIISDTDETVLWDMDTVNGITTLQSGNTKLVLKKANGNAGYEAEEALLRGGLTTGGDGNGNGYITGFTDGDAQAVFSVYAKESGTYQLQITYANTAASAAGLMISVNAGTYREVSLGASTLSWENSVITVTLKKGINTITLSSAADSIKIDYITIRDSLNKEYRGATTAYTEYEAEDGTTNAEILEYSTAYRELSSEASGRSAVRLSNTGDYVEFILTQDTNSLDLRYCIPDSEDGKGMDATLGLYINGVRKESLSLTSKYSWVYGSYPWTNNPADGKAHRFFDESRYLLNYTIPAGAVIRLQRDDSDTAAYYVIDLLDTEGVGAAAIQPVNSLSIVDYGAVAGDGIDDTDAMIACMAAAHEQNKEVWIPAGTFDFSKVSETVEELSVYEPISVPYDGLTIRGAGMWYSVLEGPGAGFMVEADNVAFYDFSIYGEETGRNDTYGMTGIETNGDQVRKNLTVANLWMEHLKVGIWTNKMDSMLVTGTRIRDTYADGMNLYGGTGSSVVEQCLIRNTGDDAIALWSSGMADSNNRIRFNTVGLPWLANNVAVYGGTDNAVTDNILHDTVAFGAGINISSNFSPVAFGGTTTAARNTLINCGGHEYNFNQDYGAIWINAVSAIPGTVLIQDNLVLNSTYQGMSVMNSGLVSEIILQSNVFEDFGTWGMNVWAGTNGSMQLSNNSFRGNMVDKLFNGAPSTFILAEAPDTAAPVFTDTGISVIYSGTQAILSWTPAVSAQTGIAAYKVTGAGNVKILPADMTQLTIDAGSGTFFYKVEAMDTNGKWSTNYAMTVNLNSSSESSGGNSGGQSGSGNDNSGDQSNSGNDGSDEGNQDNEDTQENNVTHSRTVDEVTGTVTETTITTVIDAKTGTVTTTTQVVITDKNGKTTEITMVLSKDAEGKVIKSEAVLKDKAQTVIKKTTATAALIISEEALQAAIAAGNTSVLFTVDMDQSSLAAAILDGNIKAAGINLILPEELADSKQLRMTSFTLEQAVIDAAREKGTDLKITVQDDKGKVLYSWYIDGSRLKEAGGKASDINLILEATGVKSLSEENQAVIDTLKKDKNNTNGLVLGFEHSGILPVPAEIRIYVGGQGGLKAGNTVYLYYVNETTKKLELVPDNKRKVDKDGYVTIPLTHCSDYVLLQKPASDNAVTALLDQVKAPSKVTLKKGKKTKLSIELPATLQWVEKLSKEKTEGIAQATVTFKSGDTSVVTVAKDGTLKAKKAGKTVITVTVTLADKTKKQYKITVTVNSHA